MGEHYRRLPHNRFTIWSYADTIASKIISNRSFLPKSSIRKFIVRCSGNLMTVSRRMPFLSNDNFGDHIGRQKRVNGGNISAIKGNRVVKYPE